MENNDTLRRFQSERTRGGVGRYVVYLVCMVAVFYGGGPYVEELVHPVLGQQVISQGPRAPDPAPPGTPPAGVLRPILGYDPDPPYHPIQKLCWRRDSTKLQQAVVTNYDVILERWSPERGNFESGVRSFPQLYVVDSGLLVNGRPITTDMTPPVGTTYRRVCTDSFSDVAADVPLRVVQSVHFRGFQGWWELVERLPDVNSPHAD